jgi:uncharacterized protein YbcC (UPF0753/DUF2309 family)
VTSHAASSTTSGQSDLARVVDHVAHHLPAQGPISVFIHHNTLHAFEDEPFEDAVVRAGRQLGCEPFLPEHTYRDELLRGRISDRDVDAVLASELGDRAQEPVVLQVPRCELWRRILVHGIPDARDFGLTWLLNESTALTHFREDLPRDARQILFPSAGSIRLAGKEERSLVGELWRGCLDAIGQSRYLAPPAKTKRMRHRDLLVAVAHVDPDEWIRPVLIRFIGAYLDQGLSHRPMPGRQRGIYAAFIDLYGRRSARMCGAWASGLVDLIADDRFTGRDASASLAHSLVDLGVAPEEWQDFLVDEALWLRGWAGMVRQFEVRPDRVPTVAFPARLVDYLAVQLLFSRAALRHASKKARIDGPLSELRSTLTPRLPAPTPPSAIERAWPIFHVAQLCGLAAAVVGTLSQAEITSLESELAVIDGLTRRRLLHLAYERRLRHGFYDALVTEGSASPVLPPTFQVIFCIDEREESLRRHLEELDAGVETFGAAGFFGVAMYYRGARAAHARPLCPVAITPQHYVSETDDDNPVELAGRWRSAHRRITATLDKSIHVGSRTFGRGALIAAFLGALWVIPLVLRVLFPWSRRGLSKLQSALTHQEPARLHLDRVAGAPPLGRQIGFSVEEMAEIVSCQLQPLGILDRLAPLVVVLGHGSNSLNNPHESAHDCGACGGGRGGPNARAFAQMANDSRVRAQLAQLGIHIPEGTWFVGGQRNSASSDIDLYDEDLMPKPLRPLFERARANLAAAGSREAHERCRRFESAPPSWLPDQASVLHVQTRAVDLAQPRPEYGHATNAVCVIGRRSRTRGLFLDRRAFLVSYDPMRDLDGADLTRTLTAVVPVVAGISLEYFFGYVDPTGYGCGTKLPHNVTGLLGVMDGAQSDLRTGLPWQMLEIHEPVRLTIAVEVAPPVLLRILERDVDLRRLVHGRWIFLAAIDPTANRIFDIDSSGVRPYVPEHPIQRVHGPSHRHYAGRQGHLPFVRIIQAENPGESV